MAVFNEPTQWDHALGNNADVSSLPDDTSATTGVASLQKLFQIINQTPLEAGGVAPSREDFNALFKFLGDSIFYMQNGGLWSYNPAFDYTFGRVVLYTDGNIYICTQANGASDPKAPTNTSYWGKVATLADFATFANIDLSNLSVSGQALFDAKADKDFGNINNTAKITIAHHAMPSAVRDILTLGTSGTTYTAPADGYFFLAKFSNAVNQYIQLTSSNSGLSVLTEIPKSGDIISAWIPVVKGDSVKVSYNAGGTTQDFVFIYAIGSISEQ